MTFILAEDEALRDSLIGMTVSDSKNDARPVGVWFGQPDPEIRTQNYPFVTVDLIDVSEARERVMSGRVSPWYYTPTDLGADEGWDMWSPTPINLDYQITTFARQPRHDRQILAQLMGTRLPLRFGSLVVEQVQGTDAAGDPVTLSTTRRLDVMNVVKRDLTEAGKRLFMNVFSVRVSSEIPQPFDFETYSKVLEVRMTTSNYHPNSGLTSGQYEVIESVIATQPGTP